jgi:hypothetical protein
MTGAAAALTLTLAAVLLVSGTLKLLPHARLTVDELAALGVPGPLRRPWFAAALPVAELLLGLALLLAPAPLFTLAAAATVLLTLAFTIVVAGVLRRGDRVDCSCFGMLRSPVTPATATRNIALLLAAAVTAVTTHQGAVLTLPSLATDGWTAFFATTTAVLAVMALLLLAARHTSSALDLAAAPVARDGSAWPVPDVEVLAGGELVPLADLARTTPLLIVLLSAECHACERVAPQLAGWRETFGGAVEVAALSSDDASALAAAHPLLDVPVHGGARALMTVAGIPGYPSALLVGTDGLVAGGPAVGSVEVEALAATIADVLTAASPVTSR